MACFSLDMLLTLAVKLAGGPAAALCFDLPPAMNLLGMLLD